MNEMCRSGKESDLLNGGAYVMNVQANPCFDLAFTEASRFSFLRLRELPLFGKLKINGAEFFNKHFSRLEAQPEIERALHQDMYCFLGSHFVLLILFDLFSALI